MTTPDATVKIPRPEELLAKQQQEVDKIVARRRAFMETSGQRIANDIIAELVKQVQTTRWQEWTGNVLSCETLNAVALCNDDAMLAKQIVEGLVAPTMRSAGWHVFIGCYNYVCISAIKRQVEDDKDEDEDEDEDKGEDKDDNM